VARNLFFSDRKVQHFHVSLVLCMETLHLVVASYQGHLKVVLPRACGARFVESVRVLRALPAKHAHSQPFSARLRAISGRKMTFK
jgi:hypothetical protein